jgi:predicted RNA-binding Zn-ribbon protein involved in translation (DUF1610 family)
MNWLYSKKPYKILILLGFLTFIFSIYDIVFGKEWIWVILICYIALVFLFIILILLRVNQSTKIFMGVEAFEKTLKGGLYHFKCPKCFGIFAIKKTKKNDKKPVKMTCPDCGEVGFIPVHPMCTEEDIPEKKSLKANFRCNKCGEGVTIWAEGTTLYNHTTVLSCPFCGSQKPLHRF